MDDRKPRQVKPGQRLGGSSTLKQIAAVSAAFREGKSPKEQLLAARQFPRSILSRRKDSVLGGVSLPWKLLAASLFILAVVMGRQYTGVSTLFSHHMLSFFRMFL